MEQITKEIKIKYQDHHIDKILSGNLAKNLKSNK